MAKEVFIISVPFVNQVETDKKDVNGNPVVVLKEGYRTQEFAIPACVVNKTDYTKEVQRYIDLSFSENLTCLAFQARTNGDLNASKFYTNFASHIKPEKTLENGDLARMTAYCINSFCRKWHHISEDKVKHDAIVFGADGWELFEQFSKVGCGLTMTDAIVIDCKNRLEKWFSGVIAKDDFCKDWRVKITKELTVQLIHCAGNVKRSWGRNGIKGRKTDVVEFMKQALLACFEKSLHFTEVTTTTYRVI